MTSHSSEYQSERFNVSEIQEPVLMTIFVAFMMGLWMGPIYFPAWFLLRREMINSLQSKHKLGAGIFVLAIIGIFMCLVMQLASFFLVGLGQATFDDALIATALGLNFATNLIFFVVAFTLIVQAFRVRRIFSEHFNVRLNQHINFSVPATLLFGIFYLQYKINRFDFSFHPGISKGTGTGYEERNGARAEALSGLSPMRPANSH